MTIKLSKIKYNKNIGRVIWSPARFVKIWLLEDGDLRRWRCAVLTHMRRGLVPVVAALPVLGFAACPIFQVIFGLCELSPK